MSGNDTHHQGTYSHTDSRCEWLIHAASVRGVTHERRNLPNQDSAGKWPDTAGPHVHAIISVADGHGSEKCPRSDVGSRFAVETASELCRSLLDDYGNDPTAVKRFANEGLLPRNLISIWRDRVDQHLADNPYTEEELRHVRIPSEDNGKGHYLAYGATLLVAVVTEHFILYMQLGDGDIVVVSDEGQVYRPLPRDDRLIANETTSMSGTEQPWNDFRVAFQGLAGTPPGLILLATDGYSNSFENDRGFLKVAPDIMNLILEHGFDAVVNSIDDWLHAATSEGSGDDVSVGIAFRISPMPSVTREPTLLQSAGNDHIDHQNETASPTLDREVTEPATDATDSADVADQPDAACEADTACDKRSLDIALLPSMSDTVSKPADERSTRLEIEPSDVADVRDQEEDNHGPN